ncbi:hypothetical protein GCM10010466_30310 [Planomonospora alba]|uniref:Uncharacterized protein n=1 Tax=Planomonospora alba TaxID=161354 RepID=A0ABP6N675_9ACTN
MTAGKPVLTFRPGFRRIPQVAGRFRGRARPGGPSGGWNAFSAPELAAGGRPAGPGGGRYGPGGFRSARFPP